MIQILTFRILVVAATSVLLTVVHITVLADLSDRAHLRVVSNPSCWSYPDKCKTGGMDRVDPVRRDCLATIVDLVQDASEIFKWKR